MTMNPLLKLVVVIVLIIGSVLGLRSCVNSSTQEVSVKGPDSGSPTSSGTTATAAEELRTLSIRLKESEDKRKADKDAFDTKLGNISKEFEDWKKNGSQGGSNDRNGDLLDKVNQLEVQIAQSKENGVGETEIEVITENVKNAVLSSIGNASNMVVGGGSGAKADLCSNPLGCEGDYEVNGGNDKSTGPTGNLVWVAPIDAPELVDKGKVVIENLGNKLASLTQSTKKTVGDGIDKVSQEVEKIPVFTLPVNTTLFGAKLSGRLLGRVPKQGNLTAVYGFTVVVPGKSVMANGHSLPEVSHALMSGWAEGDLGLVCAKGYITNMTFIFKDGRIAQVGEGFTGGKGASTEYIAVLQDTASSECIRGSLKTNLSRFMATSMGLSALNTGAQGLVASQNTVTTTTDGASVSSPTGSIGKIIAGNMATGAASDGQKWLSERWSDTFDAILVEIGTDVTIGIKKEIAIDYDPASRKVKYMSEDEAIAQAGGN